MPKEYFDKKGEKYVLKVFDANQDTTRIKDAFNALSDNEKQKAFSKNIDEGVFLRTLLENFFTLIILHKEVVVGWGSAFSPSFVRYADAELGSIILSDFHRRGLGIWSLKSAIEYSRENFSQWKAVVTCVESSNAASRAVNEKYMLQHEDAKHSPFFEKYHIYFYPLSVSEDLSKKSSPD